MTFLKGEGRTGSAQLITENANREDYSVRHPNHVRAQLRHLCPVRGPNTVQSRGRDRHRGVWAAT